MVTNNHNQYSDVYLWHYLTYKDDKTSQEKSLNQYRSIFFLYIFNLVIGPTLIPIFTINFNHFICFESIHIYFTFCKTVNHVFSNEGECQCSFTVLFFCFFGIFLNNNLYSNIPCIWIIPRLKWTFNCSLILSPWPGIVYILYVL